MNALVAFVYCKIDETNCSMFLSELPSLFTCLAKIFHVTAFSLSSIALSSNMTSIVPSPLLSFSQLHLPQPHCHRSSPNSPYINNKLSIRRLICLLWHYHHWHSQTHCFKGGIPSTMSQETPTARWANTCNWGHQFTIRPFSATLLINFAGQFAPIGSSNYPWYFCHLLFLKRRNASEWCTNHCQLIFCPSMACKLQCLAWRNWSHNLCHPPDVCRDILME